MSRKKRMTMMRADHETRNRYLTRVMLLSGRLVCIALLYQTLYSSNVDSFPLVSTTRRCLIAINRIKESLLEPTITTSPFRTIKHLSSSSSITESKLATRKKATKIKSKEVQEITTIEELNDVFFDFQSRGIQGSKLLKSISVKGDTQCVTSDHPVAQLLYERKQRRNEEDDKEKINNDNYKVALAIEGGGMRGCVSCGMVAAIYYLGLEDTIDVVYGSSAGSLIGAYFITRQLPYYGPEIYYDVLTSAGKKFIDTKRLLRAIGLGLLDPRLLKDVLTRPYGKPVLELSYLLEKTVQERKPLNWTKFEEMQEQQQDIQDHVQQQEQQQLQPLNVIASGLNSERSVVLNMKNGSFQSLSELAKCMHASMLLPGIAGPVMNIGRLKQRSTTQGNNGEETGGKIEHFVGNDQSHFLIDGKEPLADALIYEPFPYHSAVKEGDATHVIVLRTRPDGVDVTGKPGLFDKLIMRRYFLRKNKLPNIFRRMRQQLHKKRYAEDVLQMNKEARKSCSSSTANDKNLPHIMPIALPPGSPEVSRLENDRRTILEGVRRGFARSYDALVLDPNQRGKGKQIALELYPDDILDYDPSKYDSPDSSAFELYLKETNPQLLKTLSDNLETARRNNNKKKESPVISTSHSPSLVK